MTIFPGGCEDQGVHSLEDLASTFAGEATAEGTAGGCPAWLGCGGAMVSALVLFCF